MKRVASPKDRKYLESLNLKALQKSRPKGDQDPKEYYRGLQEEAKSGPLFTDKVLDTVEHLPDLPKPVSKWLGNMDDKELGKVDSQDLHLIIDWVQGSEDADLEGFSWDEAMEAQKLWHDQLHDNKEDCGEYETHKVVFSTGGYEFVDLTTDHDLQVEGCKLKHCVGGDRYCMAVKNNSSRIISMRNSKNEPLVTIEYRINNKSVAQCYGYKNHPPAKKLNEPLVKFFEHMGWEDGMLLLKNYTIPDDKWLVILPRLSVQRRTRMAESTRTAPTALRALAVGRGSVRSIREALARNTSTPGDALEHLARDSDHYVREAVANNRNAPGSALALLADDDFTQHAVARHPNTPKDVLIAMSKRDVRGDLSFTFSGSPNTPAVILEKLSKSRSGYVRSNIANNKNTPGHVLEVLATDTDPDVRLRVAQNPNATPRALDLLSHDDSDTTRFHVAGHKATTEATLERLSKDPDIVTRTWAISNPNMPEHVLVDMSNDANAAVRLAVAENPKTPLHILEKLADDSDRMVNKAANRALSRHPEWIARHLSASVKKLIATPKDRKRSVRLAIQNTLRSINPTLRSAKALRLILSEYDYRMDHKAPGKEGAPLHDLTLNGVYPKDVYETLHHYKDGDSYDYESMAVIYACQGKPNKYVVMYRAMPADIVTKYKKDEAAHTKRFDRWWAKQENPMEADGAPPRPSHIINPGDWVTLSKQYAQQHAAGMNPKGKVIHKRVKAQELYTDGNSLSEWGWDP